MEIAMKETFKIVWNMEAVRSTLRMVIVMLDHMSQVSLRGLVSIIGSMEQFLKVTSRMD